MPYIWHKVSFPGWFLRLLCRVVDSCQVQNNKEALMSKMRNEVVGGTRVSSPRIFLPLPTFCISSFGIVFLKSPAGIFRHDFHLLSYCRGHSVYDAIDPGGLCSVKYAAFDGAVTVSANG